MGSKEPRYTAAEWKETRRKTKERKRLKELDKLRKDNPEWARFEDDQRVIMTLQQTILAMRLEYATALARAAEREASLNRTIDDLSSRLSG